MDAFKMIANAGRFPYIVEGRGRRWATDGHRMAVVSINKGEPGYANPDDRVIETRRISAEDAGPLDSLKLQKVLPSLDDQRTITLAAPKRLAKVCAEMLALQVTENEPRVEGWKLQIARSRLAVHLAKSYQKDAAKRDLARDKDLKPVPNTFGRLGAMLDGAVLRSYSIARVEVIGPAYPKMPHDMSNGHDVGIDLRYLRDALRCLSNMGPVRMQVTGTYDPVVLTAGELMIVVMPARL